MPSIDDPLMSALLDTAMDPLFWAAERQDSVSAWMREIFLRQFEENVGLAGKDGSKLISVEKLDPAGFTDEVACLRATQRGPIGLASSTVIDFRVGRLLGVAFVATAGDVERLELTTDLGLRLERQMVAIVLGA